MQPLLDFGLLTPMRIIEKIHRRAEAAKAKPPPWRGHCATSCLARPRDTQRGRAYGVRRRYARRHGPLRVRKTRYCLAVLAGAGVAGVVAGAAGVGLVGMVRSIAGRLAGAWATFSPFLGEPLK
jgi:hypothetical protein